jgi:ATP-dependent RNA helicase SUPV3L1/SUV3
LDLFHPALLRRNALSLWRELALLRGGNPPMIAAAMPAVLAAEKPTAPAGYRLIGKQWLRLDRAEELLREAHGRRVEAGARAFTLEAARAIASGLTTASYAQLLRQARFRPIMPRPLAAGAFGPEGPLLWRWQPGRRRAEPTPPPPDGGAFAALARLVA